MKKRHMLSYLAGIIDGEGSVGISKSKRDINRGNGVSPSYQAFITVRMCDEIIPRLFRNLYGGAFYTYRARNLKSRTLYQWSMHGISCLPVLEELLPYVLSKRPQFEVVINFTKGKKRRFHNIPLTEEELAIREAEFILARELKHV